MKKIIMIALSFALAACATGYQLQGATGGFSETQQQQIEQPREYQDVLPILMKFDAFTELQRKEWNSNNQWKHWVKGTGVVSQVNEVNLFSEIKESAFEVTVELSNKNRVVLFFPSSGKPYVLSLSKGDVLDFKGRLKRITHWGFWRSAYVKAE